VMAVAGAIWGLAGVLGILGFAVYRLTPVAFAAFDTEFGMTEWAVWGVWMFFMVYAEGYRGFHRAFSPRVVARARALRANPNPINCLLAPFFCFGFFHATRKRTIVSWAVTGGIVCLVLLVRLLVQPWRGIVDCGVVAGSLLGMISIAWFTLRWVLGRPFDYPPDLPLAKGCAR